MHTYDLLAHQIPGRIVLMTAPFVRHWRLSLFFLGPLWAMWPAYFFICAQYAWVDRYLGASLLVACAVGLAWMSMWAPWDDIDRLVRYLTSPRADRNALRDFDKRWPLYVESAGLCRKSLDGSGAVVVPPLYGLEFNDRRQLVARPGLLLGQTVDDWEAALETLRTAAGALRARVVTDDHRTGVAIVFSFDDALARPSKLELPAADVAVSTDTAQLGFDEDGNPWELNLRVSTLTAGATGAGKGSVMWQAIVSQGPNVAAGLVQLQGIDLKGGMELSLGLPMFTRYATELPEAVVLLEEAAQQCKDRAKRMAGISRMHHATVEEPMVMVVIDELANLVAYQTDRDLLRRAEAALAILLTQGRAVGFYVFGFLQDPRKEVLKMRNLFPQSIALRLDSSEEGAMMLSHDAVRAGARCENIPMSQPGVGYILRDNGHVTRVRAAYVPDEQIREAAERFPAPVRVPVVVPEIEPRTRRTRADRSEAA